MEDIQSNTARFIGSHAPQSVKSSTFHFSPKHVLYGRLRPYLNKVFKPEFEGHCSTEIFPLLPAPELDRGFLTYFLLMDSTVKNIDSTCTGARMPRANMNEVMDFPIPLPPLAEQRRIVSILDEVFAGLETATANTEKNLANARELFDSYLNNIFAQRGETFSAQNFREDKWDKKQLSEICRLRNGPAFKKADLLDKGKVPVLRVGNFFTNNRWYYTDLSFDPAKYCDKGDLLYAWSASFGPRIWEGPKCAFHYHIWRIDIDSSKVQKKFLYYWLLWDADQVKKDHGAGTTMTHVSMSSMNTRVVKLPPLDVQCKIEAILDDISAESKMLELNSIKKQGILAELKQSILQKAFSGDLTKHPDKALAEAGA